MSKLDKNFATRQSLLLRLKDRYDEDSWAEFTSVYKNYLFKIMSNLNMNHQDSDDMLQSIFLKLWQKLPEFEYDPGRGQFRNWLGLVVKNDVYKFYNKRTRRNESTLDTKDFEHQQPSSNDIDEIIENEWRNYVSERAWSHVEKEFTPEVLEVFKAFATGLSGAEVAEKFNLKVNTAIVYKNRVKKALHKEMMRIDFELG